MAPIEKVPPEVFYMILRSVSGTRLRKQNALTICKWWYEFARIVAFEDLVLPARTLMRLSLKELDEFWLKFRPCVKRICINLKGFEEWSLFEHVAMTSDLPYYPIQFFKYERMEVLRERLDRLISYLPKFSRLESFTLQALCENDPIQPVASRHQYLGSWSVLGLLETIPKSKISELVLDTCGTDLSDGKKPGPHTCEALASLIPSLRTARLRMQTVCPRVFEFPPDTTNPRRLESLVLNLSLKESSHQDSLAYYSSHCGDPQRAWNQVYYLEMVRSAIGAAEHLPKLRVMDVLHHEYLSMNTISLDCITRRYSIIPAGRIGWAWVDDGQS